MKTPFPEHRWTIPNPERWKHIERVPTQRLKDTLKEIRVAKNSIAQAEAKVWLQVKTKEETIRSVWATAYTQQMKQYESELTQLAKEAARLERLLAKCGEREDFMINALEQLKVQVT